MAGPGGRTFVRKPAGYAGGRHLANQPARPLNATDWPQHLPEILKQALIRVIRVLGYPLEETFIGRTAKDKEDHRGLVALQPSANGPKLVLGGGALPDAGR